MESQGRYHKGRREEWQDGELMKIDFKRDRNIMEPEPNKVTHRPRVTEKHRAKYANEIVSLYNTCESITQSAVYEVLGSLVAAVLEASSIYE
jgi:hypothetical protein